jgi:hypothetical protein
MAIASGIQLQLFFFFFAQVQTYQLIWPLYMQASRSTSADGSFVEVTGLRGARKTY